jgi:hypothetical protein
MERLICPCRQESSGPNVALKQKRTLSDNIHLSDTPCVTPSRIGSRSPRNARPVESYKDYSALDLLVRG